MILASHGIIGSSIVQFDPDAAAFFQRVSDPGGTLTATEKTATNQLVLDLKANSLWTPMKAIYPMVGASAAACAQNLKSSSFTGTFTAVGVSYASTGVTGNGTSGYMTTGFNPSIDASANSGCLGFYSRTNNSSPNMAEIGAITTSPNPERYFQIHASIGGLTYLLPNEPQGFINFSNTNSSGFFQAFRTSATTIGGKRNATSYSRTASNYVVPNLNALVLARTANGVPNFFSNRECAFAYFGDSINDTLASNYYTIVQEFQTTLSRQV